MGEPIGDEVGRALRRARTAQGLTLREVRNRANGAFTPTAVAGYERAERSISLARFCELAALYGIPPERLLAEIMEARRRDPDVTVDLTELEDREPQRVRSTPR